MSHSNWLFLSESLSHRPVASVVVRHGTLECGQVLVAGKAWGKVRAMFDERRQPVREAPPSTPVLTVGWRDLPTAGDDCLQVKLSPSSPTLISLSIFSSLCCRQVVRPQHAVSSTTELHLQLVSLDR